MKQSIKKVSRFFGLVGMVLTSGCYTHREVQTGSVLGRSYGDETITPFSRVSHVVNVPNMAFVPECDAAWEAENATPAVFPTLNGPVALAGRNPSVSHTRNCRAMAITGNVTPIAEPPAQSGQAYPSGVNPYGYMGMGMGNGMAPALFNPFTPGVR